ncbi:lytic transglycosylase domain-containing protein [Enhygromyxa salina]|uniref:Soluble lytic murein transglycosylase n=1 Tax=Enhygromyxa salina TaxID=215803 RepID=A0A2S9XTY4_9BACT|nr:lytic transglycosylase domain-containing protein [Enhygromyxa salina]PRP96338.1 Soluble lytic murein transglycosylase precursor [Enhygromyxa salina]
MRLSPNLHLGLVLGVATAGVILALGGCVAGSTTAQPSAAPAGQGAVSPAPVVALEAFSDNERARILAVQEIVEHAASEHGVDPVLINAVIWVESRFDPQAKSPAGARGLMQLMPATAAYLAKRMGERSAHAYDPKFNVRAGSLYLAEMLAKFGDEQKAVAAYHAGPGNVKRWLEAGETFPDYSQTYVAKVMEARARFEGVAVHGRRSGAATMPAPTPAPTPTPRPAPAPDPEPQVVPDVATLPDAADIHGVARVIYAEPEPDEFESAEPVFEVHPELDVDPSASGWGISRPRTREPRPVVPAPKPKPAPSEPKTDEAGLGVLPDL